MSPLRERRRLWTTRWQQVPPVTVAARSLGTVNEMEENRFASAVPSQLMLFVFLNGLLGAAALVQARQLRVFQRTLATPHGLGVYLSGLGASRVAIALLQSAILLGLGVLSFGVDFGNPARRCGPWWWSTP
ncbi:MAG: hypothetical protein V9G09_02705 [Candidatus Nanopelagicales bacterium]